MAGLRITEFSGLAPSVNPKLLPDSGAVVASNLAMRHGDFRPRPTDATIASSGVSSPLTIYRFARVAGGAFNVNPATGWTVRAGDVNYVKGQINDDSEERTYYTGDGTPKATDTSGTVRPLGVPVPAVIGTPTITEVDEYTNEERSGDIDHMIDTVEWAVKKGLPTTYQWFGATNASSLSLTQRTTANGFNPEHPIQVVKGITGTGSVLADPLNYGFLLDPKLDGFWNSTGTFFCVPIVAYGYAGEVSNAMETELNNILDPKTETTAFLTSAQKAELRRIVDEMFDLDDPFLKGKSNELSTILKSFDQAVSRGLGITMQGAVASFYASTEVTSKLSAARESFANEVYALADRIMTYQYNSGF